MSFEETVIHCSAPALCGIKPASLFSMDSKSFEKERKKILGWQNDFAKSRRYFVQVKKEDERCLVFVFDRNLLEKIITDEKNKSYLISKGYSDKNGLNGILCELFHRLAFEVDFPHEVGLFLGYPLEDVVGFEKDRSGYKYSGIWKVYGNRAEAEKKMQLYRTCSELCMKWLGKGLSVPMVARKYEKIGV